MIYVIQALPDGPVKIGYTGSDSPRGRLSNLKTATPHDLKVLGVTIGDAGREAALHKKFQDSRIRGEWFALTDDIKSFINSLIPWEPPVKRRKERSGHRRDYWLTIPLIKDERKLVEVASREAGIPMATLARLYLLRAIRKGEKPE